MAHHNKRNKMHRHQQSPSSTYGNLAYDLERQESPYDKNKQRQTKRKPIINGHEKAAIRDHRYVAFKYVLVVIVVFVGAIISMASYVKVDNINMEIRRQKSELDNLKQTNAILAAEITEQLDLDYIKEEAVTRLGMAEPQQYQIVYIDVPKQSYTVQYAVDDVVS